VRIFLLVPKALAVTLLALPVLLIGAVVLIAIAVLMALGERKGFVRIGGLHLPIDHADAVVAHTPARD
jgi:hypothetical protein